MPSTSAKQAKFMRAVAHSPKFAKKVGVPQSVGKDFEMADKKKMKKFASAGKVGRKATEQAMTGVEDILKSAPSLVAAAQSDKTAESELKSAVAPKKAPSFAEAFRAARAAGDKTFNWAGKSYTTKMAGEGSSRSASTTTSRATTPSTSTRAQTELRRTAARSQAAIREERAKNQADFRKRMQAQRETSGIGDLLMPAAAQRAREARAAAKARADRPKKESDFAKFVSAWLPIGSDDRKYKLAANVPPGFKKGGKIDGCAIRGKTRAMKKGK